MDHQLRNRGPAEHLLILGLALVALAGSFILQPSDDGTLRLPLSFGGPSIALPPTCFSRTLLGIPCPGCGLTRSFAFMARGELKQALAFNPMGPALFLAALFQIPYRIIEYSGILGGNSTWRRFKWLLAVLAWALLAGLLAVGTARLIGHFL